MNILERYRKPTPRFFRILRNIGIALASVGGVVLASPIPLPDILFSVAAYITIAGTVASSISQAVVASEDETVVTEETKEPKKPNNHEL